MMTLIAPWTTRMDDARNETEFAEVCPADIRVFAQLRGRTVKLSQMRREMDFSRQAAQQAVDRLIGHDISVASDDPGRQGDKIVSITEKGPRWQSFAARQIRHIETETGDVTGEDAKEALCEHLSDLIV